MTRMTEVAVQEQIKRAARGWVPEEEKPRPDLPGPLDIDDRYKNNWEREYGEVHLEQRRHLGEILDWQYENVGLRIAANTFHYPDFFVTFPDHFEFHDVKGFKRETWLVKIKACKERYPYFKYGYVKKEKGIWEVYYL